MSKDVTGTDAMLQALLQDLQSKRKATLEVTQVFAIASHFEQIRFWAWVFRNCVLTSSTTKDDVDRSLTPLSQDQVGFVQWLFNILIYYMLYF